MTPASDKSSTSTSPRPARQTPTSRSRRRAAEACSFCRRRKIKCNNVRPVCANCTIYEQECTYEPISEDIKEAGRQRHTQKLHKRHKQAVDDDDAGDADANDAATAAAVPKSSIRPSADHRNSGTHAPADQEQQQRRRRRHPPSSSRSPGRDADASSTTAGPETEAGAAQQQQQSGAQDVEADAEADADGDAEMDEAGPTWQARQSQPPPPGSQVARVLVSANGVSSYHGRTSALFEDNAPERPAGAEHHRPRMPDEWVERGLVAEAVRQRQMEDLNYRQGKLDFDGVDPDLGMHLLSLHWNRQHHSFLITYRPAFMRDMACNGPYFSKLLLNAIYFGASKFSPRLEVRKDPGDVRTAGWQYRERVRELLGVSLDRSNVTTIQALLVMTNSLFALGDERSAAWLYSGLAFRMLIDLGMHVDLTSTGRFSDEDLEIRRRVFWGAFVVDKVQSLYQGRPVSLKESDAMVPIKFLDSYEELEHWQPFAYSAPASDYPGTPAYSTSTFTHLCRLSLVMSEILSCIYTERSSDQSPAELASMLDKLQKRLDKWQAALPGHLRFDPAKSASSAAAFPPPHVLSLLAMHHVLIILLHRPFVADGHLYSTSRSISVDSFMKCASAASSIARILRAYHRAFTVRRAPYLVSYATYVAATVHSRIAARRGHDSAAHGDLATCLAVFRENQETNSAVRKASVIVQSLMKRLGVVIGDVSVEALEMDEPRRRAAQAQEQESLAAAAAEAAAQHGSEQHQQSQQSQNQLGSARQAAVGEQGTDIGRRAAATAEEQNAATPYAGLGLGYSPGSDWVDIDGIIQSFLQENDPGAVNATAMHPTAAGSTDNDAATMQAQRGGGRWPTEHLPYQGGVASAATAPLMHAMPGGPSDVNNNNANAIQGGANGQDLHQQHQHQHQQQHQQHPAQNMPPPGAYPHNGGGFPWQGAWRTGGGPGGGDFVPVDDPLFGFDGAPLDNFNFMGW